MKNDKMNIISKFDETFFYLFQKQRQFYLFFYKNIITYYICIPLHIMYLLNTKKFYII